MLVLGIILALTTNVSAKEYVADDSVSINSQYHDIFNNYFSPMTSYQYFPYACTSYNNRTCYFGINEKGEYLDINYIQTGNTYKLNYSTGIDENFSVTGSNVFKKGVSVETILIYAFIFFALLVVIRGLFGF